VNIVRWSASARRDIEAIREFSDEASFPDIADKIVGSVRFISARPKAAPTIASTFERKWRIKQYPFLIFYRLQGDEIWITRVRHSRADWLSDFE
jgi:plasmid stabilization system protein ParE